MSSDRAYGPIYPSGPTNPTIAPWNSPFVLLGKKEDFDITIIILFLSHITSVCANAFPIAQCTLLTFRPPGRVYIKFLWLHVPHVLRHDEDPMAEDLIGTWAGIFPLSFPFDTNTIWRSHSPYFCNHKYQEPVRGEFLPLRKSFKHSPLLSLILFFI